MSRVFVTGATGFVGRRVVEMLLEQGDDVVTYARGTSDVSHLESLGVPVNRGDLLDGVALAKSMKGCQQLMHVAALIENEQDWVTPEDYYRVNLTGTRVVFEAAFEAGIKEAVYCDSISSFGAQPSGTVVTEETPPKYGYLDIYGHSKYLGELVAFSFVQKGMRVMAVNPTLIYGVGDRNIAPSMAAYIRGEGTAPIHPSRHRNMVHVDDVARGHLLAMANGKAGERYLLNAEAITLLQFYEVASRVTGHPPPEILSEGDAAEQGAVSKASAGTGFADLPGGFKGEVDIDNKKSREELGLEYIPVLPALEETIRSHVADFPKQVERV